MNYTELKQHAETCQNEADSMAFLILKAKKLMEFQSLCEFNVWWLYDTGPEVTFHMETVEFLLKYKDKFKRKITVKEFLKYDSIVVHLKPVDFNEFKKTLKH